LGAVSEPRPRTVGGALTIELAQGHGVGRFDAMASPCEILVEGGNRRRTRRLTEIAAAEVSRIEAKFTRYRADSVLGKIFAARGTPVEVDAETAQLLDFAARCHAISDGAFDVTSGVLRRAWRFDGSDRVPSREEVERLLPLIGWQRVSWRPPRLALPDGMELDFGGFGKEYAADRVAHLLLDAAPQVGCLVNLGGDLVLSRPRADGLPWIVGIDDPAAASTIRILDLSRGAICTSGDARRYLLKDGVRYGHILDPRTGWPVSQAPRLVTVAAGTCTEAGLLATLAMIAGAGAEAFLADQGVPYWVTRGQG
jgi:FAD:protein FMN transferase